MKESKMHLGAAVAAHSEWETRFHTAIALKQTLDVATIGKDDCCELGKWLHGAGTDIYGGLSVFTALIERHQSFHLEAGKVAGLINDAKYEQAELLIHTGFRSASHETDAAIGRVQQFMETLV